MSELTFSLTESRLPPQFARFLATQTRMEANTLRALNKLHTYPGARDVLSLHGFEGFGRFLVTEGHTAKTIRAYLSKLASLWSTAASVGVAPHPPRAVTAQTMRVVCALLGQAGETARLPTGRPASGTRVEVASGVDSAAIAERVTSSIMVALAPILRDHGEGGKRSKKGDSPKSLWPWIVAEVSGALEHRRVAQLCGVTVAELDTWQAGGVIPASKHRDMLRGLLACVYGRELEIDLGGSMQERLDDLAEMQSGRAA